MDNNIEETKTEAINKSLEVFLENLNKAIEVVSTKVIEVAPEAYEGLINLIWFKGVFDLVTFTLLVCLFLTPIKMCVKGMKGEWGKYLDTKAQREKDEKEFPTKYHPQVEPSSTWFFMVILISVSSVIAFGFFVAKILNFKIWLAVVHPEGALALKALEAAGINLL